MGIVMSSDNARKKKARRHQAATGDSYTRSRRLANERAPEPPLSAEDAARAAEVFALLSIENTSGTPDLTAAWKSNAATATTSSTGTTPLLHVPLGLQPDGTPLTLTLGDSKSEFAGSHGSLIGTTGSGKTTALQSLVFALCARYSPEMVQLVLIGAKPHSSAFTPFADYPHITHLGSLADGEQAAVLRNLMRGRSEAIERLGPPPVPHVVVVIDDFADPLDEDPEFPSAVDQLMRVGRSLDIHLLLASQQLRAAPLAHLSKNARYRIALRTTTEQDSREVIGTADAAHLPVGASGSGLYCAHPDAAPVRFYGLSTPRSLIRAVGQQIADS
jgi:DNA segregation ATPase FtsK/SpoIIIE-like protein